MLVVVATLQGAIPKACQRVAFPVDPPRLLPCPRRMEEVAFLGREQEQETIHKPQELLVELFRPETTLSTLFEPCAKFIVCLMLQEAVS